MKKINDIGYYFFLLFGLSLFLSRKFMNNVLIYILLLLFIIFILFKKNRKSLKQEMDKDIFYGVIMFVVVPYAIAFFDGGLETRLEVNEHLKFLLFLPLTAFLNDEKKFWNFNKSLLIGATISLIMSLNVFIRDYETWSQPVGFFYPRIYFELPIQDFANIMCIVLLFLISFFVFYRNDSIKQNIKIKIFLMCLIILNSFILIVNRSKMVYVCLLPVILYILYKKNKKNIYSFILICIGSYFLLPKSISERIKYIVKFKQDPSSNLRLIFWDTAISAIKEKPLFGWKALERLAFNNEYYQKKGTLEYVKMNYNFNQLGDFLNTHNMYLQYLVYFGFIGGIFLILLLFIIIPLKLLEIKFEKKQDFIKNNISKYIALEMSLKSSYMCFLIQGLTEKNLNNTAMIITFSVLLYMINFIHCMYIKKIKILKFKQGV